MASKVATALHFKVYGLSRSLRFRVQGSGFRVQGLGLKVQLGLGCTFSRAEKPNHHLILIAKTKPNLQSSFALMLGFGLLGDGDLTLLLLCYDTIIHHTIT